MKYLFMFFVSLTLSSTSFATDFGRCNYLFPKGSPPTLNVKNTRTLCFDDFAVLYSANSKSPVYCVEKVNYLTMNQKKTKRTNNFHEEPMLAKSDRSTLKDYAKSGFDRGHACPAQFRRGELAMDQSFSLGNMIPMTKASNQKTWNKNVETPTMKYVKNNSKGDVYIFTGPYYPENPKTIGPNRVWVPTYTWKVVYDSGTNKSWVFWIANDDVAKMQPPISYEEFVKRTGFNLLPR